MTVCACTSRLLLYLGVVGYIGWSMLGKGVGGKVGRRAKQLQAMEKKADGEDAYFRQCQREANSGRQHGGGGGGGGGGAGHQLSRSETELFHKQGSQGINFDNYDMIDVEVKGPGADAVAPLQTF